MVKGTAVSAIELSLSISHSHDLSWDALIGLTAISLCSSQYRAIVEKMYFQLHFSLDCCVA